MSAQRIATRYAKSLLDLAVERNELEQVNNDMHWVEKALTSRDLFLLIKSPIISRGKKKSIFRKIFGNTLSRTTNSFFDIMIRKGRENILPEIVTSFIKQYKLFKDISTVTLRSAAQLDESAVQAIRQKLETAADTHQNLELEVKVDPSLIGGFTLEFEGKQYDASLASKLRELRKQFS